MLALFSSLLSKEADARVVDNLCAAICRMIVSSAESVPLEQVLGADIPLAILSSGVSQVVLRNFTIEDVSI